jgi:hypothetical protein
VQLAITTVTDELGRPLDGVFVPASDLLKRLAETIARSPECRRAPRRALNRGRASRHLRAGESLVGLCGR